MYIIVKSDKVLSYLFLYIVRPYLRLDVDSKRGNVGLQPGAVSQRAGQMNETLGSSGSHAGQLSVKGFRLLGERR